MSSLVKTLLKNVYGSGYNVETNRTEVSKHSDDWIKATKDFTTRYEINKVEKVSQPYIEAAFLLRKHEYYIKNKLVQSVRSLMHSTEKEHISSILQTNLDWRRVHRYKYGHGVSFTNDAVYGHKHSSGYNRVKAMIVADVLVQKIKITSGVADMNATWDTAVSNTMKVWVKYQDDEFVPRYVVHYTADEDLHRVSRRSPFFLF
ncbi:zinc finger CCCH-type antiviral protein 1-like [Arctopsyche grandis]|uniref:zinc finger CCCH-type antiviral protein 1-like n=1 Tax=Arctopsyche grandis TaxID=121162 RepID=UPI00406D8142